MNQDLLIVALLAGAANWAFRALPILARTDKLASGGWLQRFLGATGPAAIATLFVAAILPALAPELLWLFPLVAGILGVTGTFYLAGRSVVLATLAGAFCHGMASWLLA